MNLISFNINLINYIFEMYYILVKSYIQNNSVMFL